MKLPVWVLCSSLPVSYPRLCQSLEVSPHRPGCLFKECIAPLVLQRIDILEGVPKQFIRHPCLGAVEAVVGIDLGVETPAAFARNMLQKLGQVSIVYPRNTEP